MSRVLVVDDDQTIRETLATLLEDDGYQAEMARDGLEAVKMLRAAREPLVVVLDMRMPRMCGDEVLRLVEGDPLLARHVFILMTAFHSFPDGLPGLLARLDVPLVSKPFAVEELLAAVEMASARLHAQIQP